MSWTYPCTSSISFLSDSFAAVHSCSRELRRCAFCLRHPQGLHVIEGKTNESIRKGCNGFLFPFLYYFCNEWPEKWYDVFRHLQAAKAEPEEEEKEEVEEVIYSEADIPMLQEEVTKLQAEFDAAVVIKHKLDLELSASNERLKAATSMIHRLVRRSSKPIERHCRFSIVYS